MNIFILVGSLLCESLADILMSGLLMPLLRAFKGGKKTVFEINAFFIKCELTTSRSIIIFILFNKVYLGGCCICLNPFKKKNMPTSSWTLFI